VLETTTNVLEKLAEDGGIKFLPNVGKNFQYYKVSEPKKSNLHHCESLESHVDSSIIQLCSINCKAYMVSEEMG
jgi:hypothetical protein